MRVMKDDFGSPAYDWYWKTNLLLTHLKNSMQSLASDFFGGMMMGHCLVSLRERDSGAEAWMKASGWRFSTGMGLRRKGDEGVR